MLLDGYKTEAVVIGSIHLSTLVVQLVLGISAIIFVVLMIRLQRCFVSMMLLKIVGLHLSINQYLRFGLAILTCHHMEEGKVPSSMAGSQDALLFIPIGMQVNQTMPITMKIM